MGHGGRHAAATILHDLLKAFDHVAYHIDAAVRTHFPVRQLKLPLLLCWAARHVELCGATGEVLRAQCGIIPGCAFSTTLFQLLLVGPPREVESSALNGVHSWLWPTTFHCSDLEATPWSRKSWNVQAPAWPTSSCKQDARQPQRSLRSSATRSSRGQSCGCSPFACRRRGQNETSGSISLSGGELPQWCDGRGWRSPQGVSAWQIVGAMAAEVGAHCACFGGESKPLRSGSHWSRRDAAAAVPLAVGVVFAKAHARQERIYGADDGGKRA